MNSCCPVHSLVEGLASMTERFITFSCSSTAQSVRTVRKAKKSRSTEKKEVTYRSVLRSKIFDQTITCLFLLCISLSVLCIMTAKQCNSITKIGQTKARLVGFVILLLHVTSHTCFCSCGPPSGSN